MPHSDPGPGTCAQPVTLPEGWPIAPVTDARCCPHCDEHMTLMKRLVEMYGRVIELAEIANRMNQKRPVGRPRQGERNG